jgi:formate hydrogenlyase transcriptional activator
MYSDASSSEASGPFSPASSAAFDQTEKLATEYFSSSPVGVCIMDEQFRFVAINDALAEMNGLPASEHLGKTVREVLGSFADAVEPEFRKVLATGISVNFEIRANLPRRTGAGHWIEHFVPIPNESGRITRVGAVVVEVTAQKALELSLHETARKLDNEIKRQEMLLEVSRLLSSNSDIPRLFPKISAQVRRLLHQEFASFVLRDADTGLLVRQAMDFPLGKGFTSKLPVSAGDGAAADALEARVPKIFSKEEIQSFEGEIARSLLAEGLQSLCCVPLLRPHGPLGVFVLGSTRQHAFKNEDLSMLEQVAAQLATAIENHRAASEIEVLKQRLGEGRKNLEGETRRQDEFAEIVGVSAALKQVLDQVATVARSEATVLILGETGTGKELIARAIHDLGRRKDGPFIKVNCAAIPTGLLESELFGHEKGSFTGAISQKIGRMELAEGGTLFLDEVGEIPLELQPKLLRVLQDQEFERLGSNRTIRVNVRMLAATNRNLAESMAQKQFRSDLFYRLSVFPIVLPPLRERREDIPVLVRHFVRKFAARMDRYIEIIPTETVKALEQWQWPGNVRELENMIERSVILSESGVLRVPLSELQDGTGSAANPADTTLDTAERQHILRVLRETRGVIAGPTGAARRLGLKRSTLQSKMQRLNIQREDYIPPRR